MPRKKLPKPKVEEDNLTHVPDSPISLGPEGQQRWSQLCEMLISRGQLSSGCFASLEQLCKLFDHIAAIDEVLDDEGVHFTNVKKIGPEEFIDVPQAHPLVRERCVHMGLMRQYLNDFGFVPKGSVVPNAPTGVQIAGVASRGSLGGKLLGSPFDKPK